MGAGSDLQCTEVTGVSDVGVDGGCDVDASAAKNREIVYCSYHFLLCGWLQTVVGIYQWDTTVPRVP